MKEKLAIAKGADGQVWRFTAPARPLSMHRHDELELNLALAGRAVYLCKDRRHELRPGMLMWLFPGQDHLLVEQSSDYAMWIAVFRPAMLRRVCRSSASAVLLEKDPSVELCKRLPPARARQLAEMCAELVGPVTNLPRMNAGLAYLVLWAWAEHEAAQSIAARDVHPAVERAARLIRDEPEAMKLSVLAGRAGLSASRLSSLFKSQTGISLTRFRQAQQLDRFLRLYEENVGMTMLEAALTAGFGSYPQFHRVFKGLMGYGPAEFRRRR